jgi:hypothetical protein
VRIASFGWGPDAGNCPAAITIHVWVTRVVSRLTFLATITIWDNWFIVRVAAFSNCSVVFPIVSCSVMFASWAKTVLGELGSRVSTRMGSTSCLSLSNCVHINGESKLRKFGKETLVVVLIRKVGVCVVVARLVVASQIKWGEVISTVVVVVFYNELPLLDYNDFSASFALVLSVSLFLFGVGRVSNCLSRNRWV